MTKRAPLSEGVRNALRRSATGKPDARRGIKLAHHAYRSRTGREPPAIKAMYFESEGVQLLPLTPEEIAEAMREADKLERPR